MDNHKLTIDLSDDMLERILHYKNIAQKKDVAETVNELINYALNLPLYFRGFDWEKAEQEAKREIDSGDTKSFDTVEDLISDLEK